MSIHTRLQRLFILLAWGPVSALSAQQPPGPPSPYTPRLPHREARRLAVVPLHDKLMPGFRKRAVMVHIQARILSASDEELWTTESNKVTIPGRPVALKLVGANLAVVVQFTPYQRPGDQWMLVAQGQLWFETAQRGGLRYETTLQTIPVKLGEQVYYFPLGSNRPGGGDYIEICLELRPYTDETEDTAHKEKPGEDHENETQH